MNISEQILWPDTDEIGKKCACKHLLNQNNKYPNRNQTKPRREKKAHFPCSWLDLFDAYVMRVCIAGTSGILIVNCCDCLSAYVRACDHSYAHFILSIYRRWKTVVAVVIFILIIFEMES